MNNPTMKQLKQENLERLMAQKRGDKEPCLVCEVERRAYGRIYPVNAVAGFLAQLVGKETLNNTDLAIIQNFCLVVWRNE